MSVLRVVFLHLVLRPTLIYWPWIQWIYPGMPEIFFVAGVLAATSLRRRNAATVTTNRLRRVLLPYIVYAPVALIAMVVTDQRSAAAGSTLTGRHVATFVMPLLTPTGSANRTILWSHLWFVTVFLWLLLLTPLLVRFAKKTGVAALLLPLLLFSASVTVQKLSSWHVPTEVLNTSQFGTFYVLGLIAGVGKLGRLTPGAQTAMKPWLAIAGICAAAGIAVALVVEPISKRRPAELYSSKSAYLLIGTAWLALALAFHAPLSAWVKRHPARWLQACTQRTFTLYLWGLPADAVGTAVAKRFLPNRLVAVPLYVGVSLAALAAAVLAVGWIEDVSARRPPRLVPRAPTTPSGSASGPVRTN